MAFISTVVTCNRERIRNRSMGYIPSLFKCILQMHRIKKDTYFHRVFLLIENLVVSEVTVIRIKAKASGALKEQQQQANMSGPLGRIIAQVVVMGAGIVSRAFVQAYQQAVHNAKTGNTAAMTAKTATRKNVMSKEQALEILNFPTSAKPKPDEVSKQFTRYFEANDPAKGGSFYLQSKIFRAKEALEREEAEEKATSEETKQ